MRVYLFTIFFVLTTLLSAQSKRGDRWVLGYSSGVPDEDKEIFGGIFLTFDSGKAELTQFDIFSDDALAVANNNEGKLEFYSTGCGIFNKNMQLMENGENLSINEYCPNSQYAMSGIKGGFLVLPQPEQETQYFYFRIAERTDNGWPINERLLLTKVDMAANNGLGKVISRNETVLEDSLVCSVSAVRHGNGRDWWVVVPRGTNRQFWTILLTPDGLQAPVLQTIPPPYTPFTAKRTVAIADPPFTAEVLYDEYQLEGGAGQADFSPDGNWYARITPRGGDVEIYHFNRCSGTFQQRAVFPTPSLPDKKIWAAGLAFSPDSKVLYMNNNEAVYQLSLSPESLKQPEPLLLGIYDGFTEFNLAVNFFMMRTAPDGKIYIGAGNGTRYLHVIEQPNVLGTGCNFRQRGLPTGRFYSFSINYFPNFNLYEAPYGLCDSLGINLQAGEYPFAVFPNPNTGSTLSYFIPACTHAQVYVHNAAGQLIAHITAPRIDAVNHIDATLWPAGVYFFSARIDDAAVTTKRVVVMR